MDTAVRLVDTYLQVNGYSTVTEYPIIEGLPRGHGYRVATDLDILAVRFPGAGRWVPRSGADEESEKVLVPPDPELEIAADSTDMIIGEVKEGRAELNLSLRDPDVLETALIRFGCCDQRSVPQVVQTLMNQGHATTHDGHHVRFVAFGSLTNPSRTPSHTDIPLHHVVNFLNDYIGEHWDILHTADFKDPTFGFLTLMKKSRSGSMKDCGRASD